MEDRRNQLLKHYESGYIGGVAITTLRDLEKDLKKSIEGKITKGEVMFRLKYNLVIENNELEDQLLITMWYFESEDDEDDGEEIKFIFKSKSIYMIFKRTFIDIVSQMLNRVENKTEENYFDAYEVINSGMYQTMVELIEVKVR